MLNYVEKITRNAKATKGKILIAWSIFFLIFGFLILIFMAILQEKGFIISRILTAIAISGFLICSLLCLIFAVMAHPYLIALQTEKIDTIYDEYELTKLFLVNKDKLEKMLQELRFKFIKEGYYKKSNLIFPFFKCHICYYVRIIDNFDIENAIQREVMRFDSRNKNETNVCFLLFIYMEQIDEQSRETVKEYSKESITKEKTLGIKNTIITILMDKNLDVGYFFDIKKGNNNTIYSYGCKLVKRLCVK